MPKSWAPSVLLGIGVAQVLTNRPACNAPDELSDLETMGYEPAVNQATQHWRQNSQSGRKGADQRKMTDPAIRAFLGNTAMGMDLRRHPAAVLGTN